MIPLYNCYWCKCAWCAYAVICEERECYRCRLMDNKGKVPYLRTSCDKFIPEEPDYTWLVKKVQKCDNCKYKVVLNNLLNQLGKSSI